MRRFLEMKDPEIIQTHFDFLGNQSVKRVCLVLRYHHFLWNIDTMGTDLTRIHLGLSQKSGIDTGFLASFSRKMLINHHRIGHDFRHRHRQVMAIFMGEIFIWVFGN